MNYQPKFKWQSCKHLYVTVRHFPIEISWQSGEQKQHAIKNEKQTALLTNSKTVYENKYYTHGPITITGSWQEHKQCGEAEHIFWELNLEHWCDSTTLQQKRQLQMIDTKPK